jgi:splicing factor 3B subunit 3
MLYHLIITATTLECLELANNDAGFSVTPVVFNSRGGEVFIAIGIVRSLLLHPRSHSGCSVSIYRVLDNRLVLLHTTDIPDVPLAMVEFQVHYTHTAFSLMLLSCLPRAIRRASH